MADYTIKNLKSDVEDAAPNFGLAPEMEARFARRALECKNLGVSYERMAPGYRGRFGHKHDTQEEVYVVLEGSGRVKIEDEVRDLSRWDALRVGPDTMRAFEAGPDGLTLIAIGAPIPEENDAELVQGWWSD